VPDTPATVNNWPADPFPGGVVEEGISSEVVEKPEGDHHCIEHHTQCTC